MLPRLPHERQLELVANGVDHVVQIVPFAAVARRIDVASAGEDQSIEPLQQRVGCAVRQQHDFRAGRTHAVHVLAGKRVGAPLGRGRCVARDADDDRHALRFSRASDGVPSR